MFNSKAYYNRISFPKFQNMCCISMLVSYRLHHVRFLFFFLKRWEVLKFCTVASDSFTTEMRHLFIQGFQFQGLLNCRIKVVIPKINIFLHAKHLFDIKKEFTRWTPVKSLMIVRKGIFGFSYVRQSPCVMR